MEVTSRGKRTNATLAFFCAFAVMWIIGDTVFMQFVHYDSQNRLLDPEYYNVEVITKEDYEQLSKPENRTVTLSSGIKKTKADIWDSVVLPNYKEANNGSQYALVTIRGTAPFVHQWYGSITPVLTICVIGIFWGLRRKRVKGHKNIEKDE